jgi:hypothetical protein
MTDLREHRDGHLSSTTVHDSSIGRTYKRCDLDRGRKPHHTGAAAARAALHAARKDTT